MDWLAKRARARLGLPKDLKAPLKIEAIFMLSDPTMWEENLQIMCDLIISRDGVPGSVRLPSEKQFVKFYMTNPDFLYADAFVLPRHAEGCYQYCLEGIFRRQYGREVETIVYGKPTARTYKFAGLSRYRGDTGG